MVDRSTSLYRLYHFQSRQMTSFQSTKCRKLRKHWELGRALAWGPQLSCRYRSPLFLYHPKTQETAQTCFGDMCCTKAWPRNSGFKSAKQRKDTERYGLGDFFQNHAAVGGPNIDAVSPHFFLSSFFPLFLSFIVDPSTRQELIASSFLPLSSSSYCTTPQFYPTCVFNQESIYPARPCSV